jgi:hypothetical protein
VSIVLLAGLIGVGCGNEGENDQGISFRAVGLYIGDISESKCTAPTTDKAIADQGIALPLSDTRLDFGYPNNSTDAFFACHGYLWLENNLTSQSIVVDRVDFEYEIPGARISIPSSSAPIGVRINPPPADSSSGGGTTQNPFGQVNVHLGQLTGQLVPAHLIEFLRQNQPSLPQLPYVMIIHITARGRSDSGDLMVSNETRYTFEFTN